jgi:hypothetical protein
MPISQKGKQILRALAQQYMEYVSLPVQKQKRELWAALNDGQMERPHVYD